MTFASAFSKSFGQGAAQGAALGNQRAMAEFKAKLAAQQTAADFAIVQEIDKEEQLAAQNRSEGLQTISDLKSVSKADPKLQKTIIKQKAEQLRANGIPVTKEAEAYLSSLNGEQAEVFYAEIEKQAVENPGFNQDMVMEILSSPEMFNKLAVPASISAQQKINAKQEQMAGNGGQTPSEAKLSAINTKRAAEVKAKQRENRGLIQRRNKYIEALGAMGSAQGQAMLKAKIDALDDTISRNNKLIDDYTGANIEQDEKLALKEFDVASQIAKEGRAEARDLAKEGRTEARDKRLAGETPLSIEDLRSTPGITEGTIGAVEAGRLQITKNGKGDLSFQTIPDVGEDAKQRERKISDLTRILQDENPDYSESEANSLATKITDGTMRIEASKDGNTISLIDISRAATGSEGARTDLVESAPQVETPKPDISLYQAAKGGTGVASGFGEFVSNTLGQIPGFEISPELESSLQKRTTLDLALKDFLQTLSLNKRYPVAITKMIKDQLNIEPSVFRSTGRMRASLRSADSRFKLEQAREQQIIDNPEGYSPSRIQEAKDTLSLLNGVRAMIGVPETPTIEEFISEGYAGAADGPTLQKLRDQIRSDPAFRQEYQATVTPEQHQILMDKTR
jgi:hypothetical protein